MQRSESYEWLLDSCLRECRKGISHLEQIARSEEPSNPTWLQEDIAELLALEAAAVDSYDTLRRQKPVETQTPEFTQERLDRLQAKLLDSFQHLAREGIAVPNCI